MIEKFVVLSVKKEDLEESITGLSLLKPVLQKQVTLMNGKNKEQARTDREELGRHFDTAITAMQIILGAMEEGASK